MVLRKKIIFAMLNPQEMASYNPTVQEVLDFLEAHGIGYEIYTHPPLFTIDEALEYWKEIDRSHTDGTGPLHCKNLFMRNHKGNRHYLISYECHKNLDIHSLEHMLHQGKLSFASEERLMRCLGVRPGSVGMFGLIHDIDTTGADPKELFENGHRVKFFYDKALLGASHVSFHPCDNSATLVVRVADFLRFIDIWGGEAEALDMDNIG